MAATLGNLAAIGILLGGGVLIQFSGPETSRPEPSVQERLFSCAMHADYPGLERALREGAVVDGPWTNGITALVVAAGEGDLRTVSVLLDHGADVNVAMPTGNSVLGAAAYGACDPQTIRTLLNAGADANGSFRSRPLVGAALDENAEVMQILLAAGADPNLTDEAGVTPLQAATAAGRHDLIALLRGAGATH